VEHTGSLFTRRAATILIACGFTTRAKATPEITQGSASLAGQLLVATPAMSDPRFAQTVILMVRHAPTGAMGITINRPLGRRPMADLMQALGQDADGAVGSIELFAGGPVQPQIGFVLHDASYHQPGTIDIDGRIAMTSSPEILRTIARHGAPRHVLVAFGYAGWGAQQLEAELAQHAWVTTPADLPLVFDTDRKAVWDAATARAESGR